MENRSSRFANFVFLTTEPRTREEDPPARPEPRKMKWNEEMKWLKKTM
jgi:hypothetical protein